jgi:hypothetical protein
MEKGEAKNKLANRAHMVWRRLRHSSTKFGTLTYNPIIGHFIVYEYATVRIVESKTIT